MPELTDDFLRELEELDRKISKVVVKEPRSYHVMVCYYVEDFYTYPYAVHLFTPEKPLAYEAFRKAEELLDKYFKNWRKEKIESRYIGIEELPVEVKQEYHVAVSLAPGMEYVVRYYGNVPKEVANKIVDYRFKHLTIDIDINPYMPGQLLEAMKKKTVEIVREIANKYINAEFYKTKRGYHIRILLPEKKDFQELIELREKYLDDTVRIRIDKVYHEKGLDYLTNILFNEKYWFEGDKLVHQIEQPIQPDKIIEELTDKKREEKTEKQQEPSNEATAVLNDNFLREIEELTDKLIETTKSINGSYGCIIVYKGVARVGRVLTRKTSLGELRGFSEKISKLTVLAYRACGNNLIPYNIVNDAIKTVWFMPNIVYAYTDKGKLVWLSLDVYYDPESKSFYKITESNKKELEEQVREMLRTLQRHPKAIILLDNENKKSEMIVVEKDEDKKLLDKLCLDHKIVHPSNSYN